MMLMLTVMWTAAVAVWLIDLPSNDGPLLLFQAVMTGLTGGIVLGAWM